MADLKAEGLLEGGKKGMRACLEGKGMPEEQVVLKIIS